MLSDPTQWKLRSDIQDLILMRLTNKQPKGQRSLTWVQCAEVKSHFQKHINWPWKPEARNRTRLSFYACTGYQQLWWWFDQKWKSSMENHFPITSLWEIFWNSRAANSLVSGPILPKFKLVRDFMHVLVTSKYRKDRIKNNQEKVETSFSPL